MKEEVRKLLVEEGFQVVDYSDIKTSVDFIAKKGKEIYVVRVLGNLDALKAEHAEDLTNLASILNARVVVVAERSRWGPLKDETIYYRHGVPAVNLKTFREIVRGSLPSVLYVKGKEIVRIDEKLLRKRREEMGLSLQKLAELVGTTKETIYRYERGYYPTKETAKKLESVLGVKLIRGFEPVVENHRTRLHFPFNVLESLGGNVREFRRLPWNALAKKKLSITFLTDKSIRKARRRMKEAERARGAVFNYILFIGKAPKDIPHIEEEELLEAKSFREIEKIARERNENA